MRAPARLLPWLILTVMAVCLTPLLADQLTPVQQCLTALAGKLNVAADQVRVVWVEYVVWPDAALGAPEARRTYAQVTTPGYRVLLGVGEHRYEFHTDLSQRAVLASVDGVRLPEDQVSNPVGEAPPVTHPQSSSALATAVACRDDLVKRLGLQPNQVTVTAMEATDFPDAALGLPRPGETAAQVVTPGYIVTLNADSQAYLYTAAGRACRFGGPMAARGLSALYLQSVKDEANLNGNLVQVSLTGASPTILLRGANGFRPQPNAGVTATRRTSRSGHDLLYLAPGATGEPTKLSSAFDFGDSAINADASRWVAYSRPRVGTAWQVSWGTMTGAKGNLLDDLLAALGGGSRQVDLPQGAEPLRLYWTTTLPTALTTQGGDTVAYELPIGESKPTWRRVQTFTPPPTDDFQLNKSETLVARTAPEQGKPVTRVIRRWFNGKETVVATIPGLKAEEMYLGGQRFALLTGRRGDKTVGITVDLTTGLVMDTVEDADSPVRLLLAPPHGWLWTHLPVQN